MTKSTIPRKQLIKKAQEQIEFCRHTKITGEGRAHVNQCAALFEIALAAMDSEPVATLDVQSGRPDGNKFALVFSSAAHKLPDDVYFLYLHAQPAPVVPEGMTIRDACKFVQDMRLFDDVSVIVMRTWNACRAAMLSAAPHSPGSEPATVPGTWIPVNERLPEAGGDMIVFTDGIVMSGVSYAKKKGFYIQALEYDDDEPVDSVTHWMPLPAAPQEVK